MMKINKWFLSFLMILFASQNFAQTKKLIQSDWKAFIPKGYSILGSCTGDLNHDDVSDKVLVLHNTKEPDEETPQKLLILFQKNKKWEKIIESDQFVDCKYCAGVTFNTPFKSMNIKNNGLNITLNAGSSWQEEDIFRFRYSKNDLLSDQTI